MTVLFVRTSNDATSVLHNGRTFCVEWLSPRDVSRLQTPNEPVSKLEGLLSFTKAGLGVVPKKI